MTLMKKLIVTLMKLIMTLIVSVKAHNVNVFLKIKVIYLIYREGVQMCYVYSIVISAQGLC